MLGTFRIIQAQNTKPVKGFVQYQVYDRNSLLRYEGALKDCKEWIIRQELKRLNDYE